MVNFSPTILKAQIGDGAAYRTLFLRNRYRACCYQGDSFGRSASRLRLRRRRKPIANPGMPRRRAAASMPIAIWIACSFVTPIRAHHQITKRSILFPLPKRRIRRAVLDDRKSARWPALPSGPELYVHLRLSKQGEARRFLQDSPARGARGDFALGPVCMLASQISDPLGISASSGILPACAT